MTRTTGLVKILLACILLFSVSAKSQDYSSIKGELRDKENKPVEKATITLLRSADSALVKIASTDTAGNFEFENIRNGSYLLSISHTGFQPWIGKTFSTDGKASLKLGRIMLEPAAKGLTEVVVTAKRPLIEQKIDKLVVNVDASPVNAGATAMEVLEKSPGIIINNDGSISLKGKPGVIVMLDGKPSYLSPADLANLLKNMPASAIDQIEIMTNPSSKYDASGNSGIINIKTKKNQKLGFNGSFTVGFTSGFFTKNNVWHLVPRTQNSLNFNYRNKKINIFGNYNPNLNRNRSELEIKRNFYNPDKTRKASSAQNTDVWGRNKYHSLKLGLDYYPNKNNVLGVVFTAFAFFGHPQPKTTSDILNPDNSLISRLISVTRNDITFRNFTGNFNYKHIFDTSGRELTVDLDYVKYSNVSDMTLNTDVYDNQGNTQGDELVLSGHLPADINIYSVKSDYTHPFNKGAKIEAGFKSSYVKNDNLVDYKRLASQDWITDGRSNHFIYDENVNAVYVNLNKQMKKWSFQAGLRMENTNTRGLQVTNDSTFRRHYTNLFPSAFVSYQLNSQNQLTFSYSRRVNRPNYQDLNPFTYFLDSLTYRQGNPYLLPQFTHNFELSHSFKGKFITTLNFSNTSDVISQIFKQYTQQKITFLTVENVARFRNMGIAFHLPSKWTAWWSSSFYLNIYNNRYEGIYNAEPLDISYTSFTANMTNSFSFPKGFSAELSGFFRAKGVDDLNIDLPMYQMSIGLQKTILKSKGTLRFNVRDPFGWQRFREYSRYNDIDIKIYSHWDNRQFSTSFTFRFGKNTIAPSRKRSSGVSEEIQRAGSGNQ